MLKKQFFRFFSFVAFGTTKVQKLIQIIRNFPWICFDVLGIHFFLNIHFVTVTDKKSDFIFVKSYFISNLFMRSITFLLYYKNIIYTYTHHNYYGALYPLSIKYTNIFIQTWAPQSGLS